MDDEVGGFAVAVVAAGEGEEGDVDAEGVGDGVLGAEGERGGRGEEIEEGGAAEAFEDEELVGDAVEGGVGEEEGASGVEAEGAEGEGAAPLAEAA